MNDLLDFRDSALKKFGCQCCSSNEVSLLKKSSAFSSRLLGKTLRVRGKLHDFNRSKSFGDKSSYFGLNMAQMKVLVYDVAGLVLRYWWRRLSLA